MLSKLSIFEQAHGLGKRRIDVNTIDGRWKKSVKKPARRNSFLKLGVAEIRNQVRSKWARRTSGSKRAGALIDDRGTPCSLKCLR